MSAYLAGEQIGVSSLVLDHARASAGVGDSTSGLGSNAAGAQDQSREGAARAAVTSPDGGDDSAGSGSGDLLENNLAGMGLTFAGAALPAGYTTASGSWLSVLA